MGYKPADFFIGVIDLFGILVPGAVFMYLDGDNLSQWLGLPALPGQTTQWVVFSLGSYVLGHFLLGVGVALNRIVSPYSPEEKDPFYQTVKHLSSLAIAPAMAGRAEAFYRAYAFLRLTNNAALGEIERQMADYKLFRSLTLVFAADVVIGMFSGVHSRPRMLASIVLCSLAIWRFLFLLSWTYRITFEYYVLSETKPAQQIRTTREAGEPAASTEQCSDE